MITQPNTHVNEQKVAQACRALRETLTDCLQRGFYGLAGVEIAVQDGTVQHIRRRMERIEK